MRADKIELIRLLEERYWATSNDFEARKRRLQAVPLEVVVQAISKARKICSNPQEEGLELNEQEWCVVRMGFTADRL